MYAYFFMSLHLVFVVFQSYPLVLHCNVCIAITLHNIAMTFSIGVWLNNAVRVIIFHIYRRLGRLTRHGTTEFRAWYLLDFRRVVVLSRSEFLLFYAN